MVCRQCGGTLKEIGFTKVRNELEYVSERVRIIRYMQQACECPTCKHKMHPFIKKADTPSVIDMFIVCRCNLGEGLTNI